MTGEMLKSEVTREEYPMWFEIADAVNGTVEPFDHYQGPYISVGKDIRVGNEPYAIAPQGLGVVRLWIVSEDSYTATIYNEANEKHSEPFSLHHRKANEDAINAALSVLD